MSQDIVNYFYCSQLKSNASEHAWVGVTLAHITCQGKMASLRDQKGACIGKACSAFCLQFAIYDTVIQHFSGHDFERVRHVKQTSWNILEGQNYSLQMIPVYTSRTSHLKLSFYILIKHFSFQYRNPANEATSKSRCCPIGGFHCFFGFRETMFDRRPTLICKCIVFLATLCI